MQEFNEKKQFRVQRQKVIAASAERLYGYVVNFHKWVDWSPWEGIDPMLSRTYSGPDEGVGASYAWSGNHKVGTGSMTITTATPYTTVELQLNFLKPFKAENQTVFLFEEQDGETTVTWTMTGKKTLMSKIMGIFMSMDKMIGKDFEKGLAQLGEVVKE